MVKSQTVTDVDGAFIYSWFSNLFAREFEENQLAQYQSDLGQQLLTGLDTIEPLRPVVSSLKARTKASADLRATVLSLASSYARLFLGVGGRRSVPPYQSAFNSDEARLFQQPVEQMNQLLREHGLMQTGLSSEPSDHLAIQLALAAKLRQSGDAAAEMLFLDTHLLSWVPHFSRACVSHDTEGFYGCLALSLQRWLEAQKEELAMLCEHQSKAIA